MSQAQIDRTHQSAWVSGSRKRADVKSWPRPIGGARTAVQVIRRAAMVQAYEVALIASFAARAPLHLVGGGFDPARGVVPPVQAHTAPTARPVLLVHGFGGTKSSWSLLARCVKCPRPDRRRDHLHAVRYLGGTARRPARR